MWMLCRYSDVHLVCYLLALVLTRGCRISATQDQTSSRPNTLSDDADDLQTQLDYEARNRHLFDKPSTVWVFHFPNGRVLGSEHVDGITDSNYQRGTSDETNQEESYKHDNYSFIKRNEYRNIMPMWSYTEQCKWSKDFPCCKDKLQSPIDLPMKGLVPVKARRRLRFHNYDALPVNMTVTNDGTSLFLSGTWSKGLRPGISAGAAYRRSYLFYRLYFHSPSEHSIATFKYPVETQAFFYSAEYQGYDEAVAAAGYDPQSFIAVATLYKFSSSTHKGLLDVLKTASNQNIDVTALPTKPLSHYCPPFTKYACYQGSLPFPPCEQCVLWFVRGKALTLKRESSSWIGKVCTYINPMLIRYPPNPVNDRKIFFFY